MARARAVDKLAASTSVGAQSTAVPEPLYAAEMPDPRSQRLGSSNFLAGLCFAAVP